MVGAGKVPVAPNLDPLVDRADAIAVGNEPDAARLKDLARNHEAIVVRIEVVPLVVDLLEAVHLHAVGVVVNPVAAYLNPAHIGRSRGNQHRLFLGGSAQHNLLSHRRRLRLGSNLRLGDLHGLLFNSLGLVDVSDDPLGNTLGLDSLLSTCDGRQRGKHRSGKHSRNGGTSHHAAHTSEVRILRIHTNHSFFESRAFKTPSPY